MDGGAMERGARWVPGRLPAIPARFLPLAKAAWLLTFAIALVAVTGGAWRGYVQAIHIDPAWTRLGLVTDYPDTGGFDVNWATEAAEKAGVVDGSTLLAVDGRTVVPDISEEAAARLISGADGMVRLTLRAPDGTVGTASLSRAAPAADSDVISDFAFFLMSSGTASLAGLGLLAVAALLARRRFADPVSLSLSFAFLMLAMGGLPASFWWWLWIGLGGASDVTLALFVVLFMAAVPAFPDSAYRSWLERAVALAAVPAGIIMLVPQVEATATVIVIYGGCIAAALCPLLRFRTTPHGLQRQQLKWVGAGFLGALVTLGFGMSGTLIREMDLLPVFFGNWVRLTGIAMTQVAMLMLPLGLLISLLKFRLWDADAVIGRSAGWALLTLTAGAVWAGSTAIIDEAIKGTMGAENQGLAAAASTVFAVLVLAPAHERIVGWMDARFRANILKLRELPQRLQIWQHGDTPEDIGARVVEAVCRCLNAESAAMLLHAGDGYRIVGANGVATDRVAGWVAAHGGAGRQLSADRIARDDALFPLRLVLDDGAVAIGALLLGRRSDGSVYSRDERAALDALETPLAAALRQAQRRRASEARTAGLIAEIEARLRGLEHGRAA